MLYSANGKKISGYAPKGNQGFMPKGSSLIPLGVSIKDLLDNVKEEYSDILPKTVSEYFEIDSKLSKQGDNADIIKNLV